MGIAEAVEKEPINGFDVPSTNGNKKTVVRETPPSPPAFLRSEDIDTVRLDVAFEILKTKTRGGVPNKIVTVIQGGPGVGKTALLSQIGIDAAKAGYLIVGVFKDEGRFAASVRLGQQLGLDRSRLESKDPAELESFEAECNSLKIFLPDADASEWTLEAIIKYGEGLSGGKPWVLLLDSIQTVYTELLYESPRLGIDAKMKTLEDAAKKGAWVFAVSEMNRSGYRNKDESMNSLPIASSAESRSIEFKSRLILSLSGSCGTVVKVDVPKNSPGGHLFQFYLKFDPVTALFSEADEIEAENAIDSHKKEQEERRAEKVDQRILNALSFGELNLRALREKVTGSNDAVDKRLSHLVAVNKVLERPGRGTERLFSLVTGTSVPGVP